MNEMPARGDTRIAEVMTAIRQRIAARSLTPGAKLPSIRALAASMRLSKSTVVEAYERLVAEGIIRSKPGAGYYVAAPLAPLFLAETRPELARAVDPLWISRQSLDAGEGMLMPGCGWLPASWMPHEAIRRGLRTLSRADDAVLTDYGTPLGLPALRNFLARRMGGHGIEASPAQIILTDSGTQAIDLICRFLLEPGDTVLVDDPCYFNFHALLRAHRVKVIGVPYTPSGPDIALFAQVLETHRPRLYITNAAIHNPSGAILSPVTAHRVLRLAEQFDLTIVEDEIFCDFEMTPAPRLAAFDGLERVIQIGSFSKTLSASVRCGYIAARADWIEGLTDLKIATTFGGTHLQAALVLALLTDGSYRKHMEALRQRLAAAMAEAAVRLRAIGVVPWIEPKAGMLLWCRLPDGIDAAEVARHALAEKIVLAPGNVFSQSADAGSFMRFNVAQLTDPRILPTTVAAMRAASVPLLPGGKKVARSAG